MASHSSSAAMLPFFNFRFSQCIGKSLTDIVCFKCRVVNVVQPPVGSFTYYERAIIVAYSFNGGVILSSLFEGPLPDRVVHNTKAYRVCQCERLPSDKLMSIAEVLEGRPVFV